MQPGDNELKLSDLFSMATLISESDRLECLELEIMKNQPLGQILTAQGLVTQETLETAVHLQTTVATDEVRAYQAADALRRVAVERISVYQVLAELRALPQTPPMRLGDMLVAASFATHDQIEQAITQSHGTNVAESGRRSSAASRYHLRVEETVQFVALPIAGSVRFSLRHPGSGCIATLRPQRLRPGRRFQQL